MDWVKDLGRKNVEDLLTIIQWNEDNVSVSLDLLKISESSTLTSYL